MNNCSNLENVVLGCKGRWPAAGYRALCMARLPNLAQGACFPAGRCLCELGERTDSMCDIFAYPLAFPFAISWQTCLGEMVNYHCSLLHHVDQVNVLHSVRGCLVEILLLISPALTWEGKEGSCWDSVFPVLPQRCPRVCSAVSELMLYIA